MNDIRKALEAIKKARSLPVISSEQEQYLIEAICILENYLVDLEHCDEPIMNHAAKVIVSVRTGYQMCPPDDIIAYIEKKQGYPIFRYAPACSLDLIDLRNYTWTAQEDFKNLCEEE